MKENFGRFNGKNCCWYTSGNGSALVFLHGFLEDASIWKNFALDLSASFKIINVDLPGHGKTESDPFENTISWMADMLAFILKQENCQEAIVIGHSMGGYAALSFLERYPEFCKGVVLFNSTCEADHEQKKIDRDRTIKVLEKNPMIFIQEAIPNLFKEENRIQLQEQIVKLVDQASKLDIKGTSACLRGMKNRKDQSELLKKLAIPLLFIAGDSDNIIPLEKSLAQIKYSNYIQPLILNNCGHMGFMEKENETLSAIKRFANEIFKKIS